MSPQAWTQRFRCWAVPALLCFVASLHLVRVYAFDQSAWGAGCGFGMFSKVDYHGSRIQCCLVDTNRGTFAVHLERYFPELDFQSKVLPTDRNLRRLADAVAATPWGIATPVEASCDTPEVTLTTRISTSANDSALLHPRDDAHPHELRVHRVRVEQWRIAFWGSKRLIHSYLAKVVETETGGKD